MGQIRERTVAELALRGLPSGTRGVPAVHARFVAFHNRPPSDLGTEHVRAWVLHLLQVQGRDPRTVNVQIGALRFLFDVTVQRPDVTASVRTVCTRNRQPDVPAGSLVAAVLGDSAEVPKALLERAQRVVLRDGDLTRFGIVQAITLVAHQSNKDHDVRFAM